MLLRHIVEPLICTLVKEQAGAIQAIRSQRPSAEAAYWAEKEGICALMPCRGQLPQSLQKLLNLPSIYKELSRAPLFPPLLFGRRQNPAAAAATELVESARSLAAQIFTGEIDTKASAQLLSYTASVQPLPPSEGMGKQHQAVHEYLSGFSGKSGQAYKFCDVIRSVSDEFKSANLSRYAELSPALLASCLREDSRSNLDALTAIELLGYVLSEELPTDVVAALEGLKLAPLCSGKVACFGSGVSKGLYYAFPVAGSASSALAQRVLQQLVPTLTLDLSSVGAPGSLSIFFYFFPPFGS